MIYYLTIDVIKNAYNELIKFNANSPGILHIFFILKGAGFNSETFEPVGNISKIGLLPAFKLSSLYSPYEKKSEQYNFISPFQMDAWAGQAPSESLEKWVSSRIKNNILGGATTWRALVTDNPDGTTVKFKHDYLNVLVNEHLGSQKIPAGALAIWINRFTQFNRKISLGELIENTQNEFNFKKIEKFKLFKYENKLNLSYSDVMHDASVVRKLIGKPSKLLSNDWAKTIQLNKIEKDNLNYSTKDFINNNFGVEKMEINKIYELLKNNHQIILNGPPGTSKSFIANHLANDFFKGNVTKVQFHPKYSYQDFIGGYVVKGTNVNFELGVLLGIINNMPKNKDHLLIIDEINRANVGQVFGETIQLLDRGNSTQIRINGKLEEYSLPDNLYIVGTMNSADRTLGGLDFAIRRRFSFIYCPPDPLLISDLCEIEFELSVPDFLRKINQKLFETLKNQELAIGHTFFLSSTDRKNGKINWKLDEFVELFNYKVLPMIEEYCHGNQSQLNAILGSELIKRLSAQDFLIAANNFTNAN